MLNQYNNQNSRTACGHTESSCGCENNSRNGSSCGCENNSRNGSSCGCGGSARNGSSCGCGARTWERRSFGSCGCGGSARTENTCGCSQGGARTWERRSFGTCGCGGSARTESTCGCKNQTRTARTLCGCGSSVSGASTVWKNRQGASCGCTQPERRTVCDQGAKDCGLLDGQSLAMVYSPYQKYEEIYDPREGLCNGTIFYRLNKPFCGDGRR